jgi:hypothetical protein
MSDDLGSLPSRPGTSAPNSIKSCGSWPFSACHWTCRLLPRPARTVSILTPCWRHGRRRPVDANDWHPASSGAHRLPSSGKPSTRRPSSARSTRSFRRSRGPSTACTRDVEARYGVVPPPWCGRSRGLRIGALRLVSSHQVEVGGLGRRLGTVFLGGARQDGGR